MRVAAFAVLVAIASTSFGCRLVAPTNEYALYRRSRVAPTLEERLRAAHDYLEAHPDGAYAEKIKRFYSTAEPKFFAAREKTTYGLRMYLEVLPRGPHAAEIRSRLTAIEDIAAQPDALVEAARATEERLAAAQRSRETVQKEFATWVTILADPDAYRRPLVEGPVELVVGYSLSLPAPTCETVEQKRTCTKDLSRMFLLPARGGGEERAFEFVLTLDTDESGRPLRARLAGEDLFFRFEETFTLRTVNPADDIDVANSRRRASASIRSFVQAKVTIDDSCDKPAEHPVIVDLACSGMKIFAKLGSAEGEDDAITFEPVGSPP
jgi:hypothetical protein